MFWLLRMEMLSTSGRTLTRSSLAKRVEHWVHCVQPLCAAHMGDVELDVLCAVYNIAPPVGVAQPLSSQLDAAIRHAVVPEVDMNAMEEQLLQVDPNYPHLGLSLMLVEHQVRAVDHLYSVGAYLKRLENNPIAWMALPENVFVTHEGNATQTMPIAVQ